MGMIPGQESHSPNPKIHWEDAEKMLGGLARQMEQTPQEPQWHGEGNVLEHTRMVWEALSGLETFQKEEPTAQWILRLAALLHDVGKTVTTCKEDGRWVSPGHARVSSEMARQLLWLDLGLCGAADKQNIRETVCNLIRFHTLPPHAMNDADGGWKLRRAASTGELASFFTAERLCLLSEADALGRICADQQDLLYRIRLAVELAQECGCRKGPFPFPSGHTRFAYLSGRNVPGEYELYNDTWGQVILMSGLPGTGKDTWIREHYPDLPMISLDELRKALGIAPTAHQGPVIDAAREQARELLRKKQPVVWNATNIIPKTRTNQVELFTAYGASTKIVYLETQWHEQLLRNGGRGDAVPEQAIAHMLEKLVPPQPWEAAAVEWHCV